MTDIKKNKKEEIRENSMLDDNAPITSMKQLIYGTLTLGFPGQRESRIELSAAQMALLTAILGIEVEDGAVSAYSDEKLSLLYEREAEEEEAVWEQERQTSYTH